MISDTNQSTKFIISTNPILSSKGWYVRLCNSQASARSW